MRVVTDTNVVISGLPWGGPPNLILKWARDAKLEIVTCEETANKLKQVIRYKRFSKRLSELEITPGEAFAYYMNLVTFVPDPKSNPTIVHEDPFDNIFLAVARENKALLIISGDGHLLKLKEINAIQIVTPSEAVRVIESLSI